MSIDKVKNLVEANSLDDANEYLADGHILVAHRKWIDPSGNENIVYILGGKETAPE